MERQFRKDGGIISITDLNPGYGEYQQRLYFQMNEQPEGGCPHCGFPSLHYEVASATGQEFSNSYTVLDPYLFMPDSNLTDSFGKWFHIAVVRGGNSPNDVDVYIDGYRAAQHTLYGGGSGPELYWSDKTTLTIGGHHPKRYGEESCDTANPAGGNYSCPDGSLNGYIDEFRISNIARYSGTKNLISNSGDPNFTPNSSGAFPNDDANTLLLLHFDECSAAGTEPDACWPAGGDDDWSSVKLLLHSDTTDGTAAIVDSTGAHTVINNQGVVHDPQEKQFGESSLRFDGHNYLQIVHNSDFNFNGVDATIEFWYKYNQFSLFHIDDINTINVLLSKGRYKNTDTGWAFTLDATDNKLGLVFFNVDATNHVGEIRSNSSVADDQWHHIAATRKEDAGTPHWALYVDGVTQGTFYEPTGSNYDNTSADLLVGAAYGHTDPGTAHLYRPDCYLEEVRISQSLRYESDFPNNLPTDHFCSGGTGGSNSQPGGGACAPTGGDPDWDKVKLMIYSDHEDGSTSIMDSSASSHSVINTDLVSHSAAEKKFPDSSIYFPGTTDSNGVADKILKIPNHTGGDFDFNDSDATIEFWYKHVSFTSPTPETKQIINKIVKMTSTYPGWGFREVPPEGTSVGLPEGIHFWLSGMGSLFLESSADTLDGGWHHIAVTREHASSNSSVAPVGHWRFYVDGVLQVGSLNKAGTASSFSGDCHLTENYGVNQNYDFDNTGDIVIGAGNDGVNSIPKHAGNFYIEDIRISKARRYSGLTFTPPTEPHCQAASVSSCCGLLCDSGPNNHTITDESPSGSASLNALTPFASGGSAEFDGTEVLVVKNHQNWSFAENVDYTIEFWFNPMGIDHLTGANGSGFNHLFQIADSLSSTTGHVVECRLSTTPSGGPHWLNFTNSDEIGNKIGTETQFAYDSSGGSPPSQWFHVAIERNTAQGVTNLYLDGALMGIMPSPSTHHWTNETVVTVGGLHPLRRAASQINYDSSFAGLMDEFRISSAARYNLDGSCNVGAQCFTPSTGAFDRDSGTLLLLHFDQCAGGGTTAAPTTAAPTTAAPTTTAAPQPSINILTPIDQWGYMTWAGSNLNQSGAMELSWNDAAPQVLEVSINEEALGNGNHWHWTFNSGGVVGGAGVTGEYMLTPADDTSQAAGFYTVGTQVSSSCVSNVTSGLTLLPGTGTGSKTQVGDPILAYQIPNDISGFTGEVTVHFDFRAPTSNSSWSNAGQPHVDVYLNGAAVSSNIGGCCCLPGCTLPYDSNSLLSTGCSSLNKFGSPQSNTHYGWNFSCEPGDIITAYASGFNMGSYQPVEEWVWESTVTPHAIPLDSGVLNSPWALEVSNVGSYTVHVAMTDENHVLLSPSVSDSATFYIGPTNFVEGYVPNWMQPKYYEGLGIPSGTISNLPGSGGPGNWANFAPHHFDAWCVPTAAACQLGHLNHHWGLVIPTFVSDGVDAGEMNNPDTALTGTIDWDAGIGWGDYLIDGPSNRACHQCSGALSGEDPMTTGCRLTDFGWFMNTNDTCGDTAHNRIPEVIQESPIGTKIGNAYAGMKEFYATAGYSDIVGMIYHMGAPNNNGIPAQPEGITPRRWQHLALDTLVDGSGNKMAGTMREHVWDIIRDEIAENRTIMACFGGWNLRPMGSWANAAWNVPHPEGERTRGQGSPEGFLYYHLGGHVDNSSLAFIPEDNAEVYDAPGESDIFTSNALGHTVLIVGYIPAGHADDRSMNKNTDWLIVRDNSHNTARNVVIPFYTPDHTDPNIPEAHTANCANPPCDRLG